MKCILWEEIKKEIFGLKFEAWDDDVVLRTQIWKLQQADFSSFFKFQAYGHRYGSRYACH
jgi:hypothetical protein